MLGKKRQQKQEALAEWEATLARKDQFFMAASHQLKSPVAIMQWCLQSILENDATDRKSKEMARKALVQAGAMSQLITDMLAVFRLERKEGEARSYDPVDMNRLVDAVMAQCEPAAHNRGVHLVRGPQERLGTVWADEGYLKQALVNLVDNAVKYSHERGTVTVTVAEKKGWAEVAVADEGIGMTQADQRRLFTEFFRSSEAQAMTHEGTGLGLVLAKRVLEAFGGEITVKSAPGKGSTFTARLPLHS